MERTLKLYDGTAIPKLGQGTWYLGDQPEKRADEIAALRTGFENGMTLIDSAEMYGSGRAEALVGEAVQDIPRETLYLVSKVYPHHAGRTDIFDCCDASIRRMNAGYLDLYLLHWRGSIPLAETAACMEELVERGKIRHWGVSNFDTDDMEELFQVKDGDRCAVNQVLYHLGSRGVEYDLLPWLTEHNVPLMAYCPAAQGGGLRRGLLEHLAVQSAAKAHGVAPIQVLLAFVLAAPNVLAIPRTGNPAHAKQNAETANLTLTREELMNLSNAFPAPDRKVYLDIL